MTLENLYDDILLLITNRDSIFLKRLNGGRMDLLE